MQLTARWLRVKLNYDPISGDFTWARGHTTGRVQIGALAGWLTPEGYRMIQVEGKCYLAHRLAWLYVTGSWPENDIDHKNTIRSDNSWKNLRPTVDLQNQGNRKRNKNKKSGLPKGVYANGKKYSAQLTRGDKKHIGTFFTIEEALEAYTIAAKEKFGEFYRAG